MLNTVTHYLFTFVPGSEERRGVVVCEISANLGIRINSVHVGAGHSVKYTVLKGKKYHLSQYYPLSVQNNVSMYLCRLWVCEVESSNFDFLKNIEYKKRRWMQKLIMKHIYNRQIFFVFFELFRAILASKLAKSANMTQKNFLGKKSIRSQHTQNPLKNCKKVHAKKLINKKVMKKFCF